MAKITLQLDLENQEDYKSMMRFLKSQEMAFVLFQMQNNAKGKFKHAENSDFLEGVEAVLNYFYGLLEDHSIIIEDLTD